MLDSANYNSGTVTVSKNVSIRAIPGQVGSIVAVAGNPAMVVSPGISLSLRNLSFTYNANNPGTSGITMTTGTVAIEDLVFASNTGQYSIYATGAGQLSVHGSSFRGPGSGIYAQDGPAVEVADSRFIGGGFCMIVQALSASTTTTMSVRDSAFTGCNTGLVVFGTGVNAVGKANVTRSSFLDGSIGVISQGNGAGTSAIVTISGNDASGNSTVGFGQYFVGSVLESVGNNTARNNFANTVGTITPVPQI